MILVTGATGNVGRNLVRELLDAGEKVRALTRDPATSALPDGVETVPGDLTRPETLPAALQGVDRAFLFPVHGALDAFLKHAKEAGTQHIVLLSSDSVTFPQPGWIGEQHLACEQAVADSGMSWSFVRPTVFMANDLGWAHQLRNDGTVRGAYGGGAMAPVDERDIAAVAAHALLAPDPGKTYELTGPQALSQIDRVRIIGETLGLPARFEEIPREDVHQRLINHMPPPAADFLLDQLAASRTTPTPVLPTIEQVTGRPAHTYAEWVAHHAADFNGGQQAGPRLHSS
ncbi:NAD(P)H-binding protein [Streptomyces sp. NPDC050315]|uniref:NAD(P)H-binding protein n=1 Tax=Streptomyces sp. NPDC050315 TaxID=3155039 RepID=UPI003433AAF6